MQERESWWEEKCTTDTGCLFDILRLLGVSLLGWKEALSFGTAVEGSVFLSEYWWRVWRFVLGQLAVWLWGGFRKCLEISLGLVGFFGCNHSSTFETPPSLSIVTFCLFTLENRRRPKLSPLFYCFRWYPISLILVLMICFPLSLFFNLY